MFEDLLTTLRIHLYPGATPVKKPALGEIAEFETAHFMLPQSYREFIVHFGPGELGCLLRIAAPGYDGDDVLDLVTLNKTIHEGDWLLKDTFEYDPLLERLFYFATTYGSDFLGWDIFAPNEEGEFPIYVVPRNESEIARVTDSFASLIYDIVRGTELPHLAHLQAFDDLDRHTFSPGTQRNS